VALPDELGEAERRALAVRFASSLARKYGCAVDVALHGPDREGDQRNWHAHLLATTRQVTAGALAGKCEIELSDAKRLHLGLAPARIEVEAVRQMWAEEVNRQLSDARRPERVDHRSLAAQREEAVQKGQAEKAGELDRAPQVKLGWKVIQMVRRAVYSDRADQLRQVQADNAQRRAVVLDIGQLRNQLARRQEEEAARRRETEQKKLIEEVEAIFRGHGPIHREATLKRWRYLASREVPDVANARAIWERDPWDPDAKAWRETVKTIEWETNQVTRASAAVAEWRRQHPVRSLALRTGLTKPPAGLQRLEQTHAESMRFLQGSQRRLKELEQAWPQKRLAYEQKLEQEGKEIRQAKRFLGVIEAHAEHFRKLSQREDEQRRQTRGREERRSRDQDRGWSR
jgi:hypothetical protein